MISGDGLPYIGMPCERVETAQAEYAEAYEGWADWVLRLRGNLDALHEGRTAGRTGRSGG